jgi:hypothetical protein
VLTRGDMGIPQYTSEKIRLYIRSDAQNAYNISKPLPIPKRGEMLATKELKCVLKKSTDEVSEYDYQVCVM